MAVYLSDFYRYLSTSQDLEDVVNAAEAGIIVVSFGSYVDISVMENFQRTLIEAFSRLPQVVVWATKRPPYPLPPNIRVFDWIPQNDLLGETHAAFSDWLPLSLCQIPSPISRVVQWSTICRDTDRTKLGSG